MRLSPEILQTRKSWADPKEDVLLVTHKNHQTWCERWFIDIAGISRNVNKWVCYVFKLWALRQFRKVLLPIFNKSQFKKDQRFQKGSGNDCRWSRLYHDMVVLISIPPVLVSWGLPKRSLLMMEVIQKQQAHHAKPSNLGGYASKKQTFGCWVSSGTLYSK